MKRTVAVVLGLAALLVSPAALLGSLAGPTVAAAATRHVRITVKPRTGAPESRFVVRFRAPDTTGTVGASRLQYILSAYAAHAAAGCVASIFQPVPATAAHARVKLTLDPRRGGAPRWCPGAFHGRIDEIRAPLCLPGRLCPAFVVLVGTIGRFGFHVQPPGGDATPPSFSGLTQARACTPGAQRPGQTTPVTLSWPAGSDNRTPASKLVYDIFMASTPGGEDFLRPSWTTAPGATSYTVRGLPSHGGAYFVVRARDQAGNEDANTVEHPTVDPCL